MPWQLSMVRSLHASRQPPTMFFKHSVAFQAQHTNEINKRTFLAGLADGGWGDGLTNCAPN